ncbi:MAG: dimethylsulfoniopropionate demethylase [bacterium]
MDDADKTTRMDGLTLSRRLRRTPFTERVEAHGVRGFSVVNHMLLPKLFAHSVEDDYWHLREFVQLWDVSCQRQVEIRGADAAKLVQWMTPRDISRARVGDCLYAPLVDSSGGIVNDPIVLKLGDDHFWLSIADSDVLLWAQGLALGAAMDARIEEPDVSPLAVQGPRAEAVMAAVFGDGVRALRFFRFARFDFMGGAQVIARSGYSSQDGFEIYLAGGDLGAPLWDALWRAGEPFNIRPGCPNLIDRIECGLLSYGNEMTRATNPLECNLDAFCDLDRAVDCLGTDALRTIAARGVTRRIGAVRFDGAPCPPCAAPWPITLADDEATLGEATSAIFSPRLRTNIALAMLDRRCWAIGQRVLVHSADGETRHGEVAELPFA